MPGDFFRQAGHGKGMFQESADVSMVHFFGCRCCFKLANKFFVFPEGIKKLLQIRCCQGVCYLHQPLEHAVGVPGGCRQKI